MKTLNIEQELREIIDIKNLYSHEMSKREKYINDNIGDINRLLERGIK